MNTKDRGDEGRKKLYEAIAPHIESYRQETDRYETRIERLNRNLRRSLAMHSAKDSKPSVGGSPRLFFERQESPIPNLVTATLVWKIDGDLPLEEEMTGMFDDAGNMHQCSDDGHYSRDNFDEALPTATKWAKDLIWKVEVEAQKIRSRLNGIRDFARAIERMPPFPKIEVPASARSESKEEDSPNEF
jgi:hypothetical protein